MIKPFKLKKIKPETFFYLFGENQKTRKDNGINCYVTGTDGPKSFNWANVEVALKPNGNPYHFANLVNKAMREDAKESELIF